MASNRHLGRIIALQTLYECDFRSAAGDVNLDLDAVLARNIDRYRSQVDDKQFIKKLVAGTLKHQNTLDTELQPVAPEWPLDQIARIDRTILRLGWFELKYEQDVPPKVVINEAVELAKAFGGENSSKFINGVLGTLLRQSETEAADSKSAVQSSAKMARKVKVTTDEPKQTTRKSIKRGKSRSPSDGQARA